MTYIRSYIRLSFGLLDVFPPFLNQITDSYCPLSLKEKLTKVSSWMKLRFGVSNVQSLSPSSPFTFILKPKFTPILKRIVEPKYPSKSEINRAPNSIPIK